MNLPFGLRRTVHAVTAPSPFSIDSPPLESPTDHVDEPETDPLEGGLVGCYASRRRRTERVTPSPTPGQSLVVLPIGRGTAEHASSIGQIDATMPVEPRLRGQSGRRERTITLKQRLIAAGLVVTLCFAGTSSGTSAQQRYRVQAGDSLASVAAEFNVDPEAILRSSWLANPPELTPGDVIVIPDPGQLPDEAAATAAVNVGTSPWTTGAYWVEAGDTIESIASAYGVDPNALLDINGLTWSDVLYPGDRLVIPGTGEEGYEAAAAVSGSGDQSTASTPSLDAYVWVPTHRQERNLSCEYASVFIATSAFENPIPEWVYSESIPVTNNPHYGYRGDIDGLWGNYDDYGIYPEPLEPILNDYGYATEVFYAMDDSGQLRAHLDAGHPVVTWLAFWGDTGQAYDDEGNYTVFAGMHVVVAYGYDDDGVYISDPATGSYRFLDWGTYSWMSGAIDGMSMAIYPS
jgi:LysM repeat protein